MAKSGTGRTNMSNLPAGLADMITAFLTGVDAKGKRVDSDVVPHIIERFEQAFETNASEWPTASAQVKLVASVCGRLAALYADLDASPTVEWSHARYALRDGQAECQAGPPLMGKHCSGVNLGLP